MIDSDDPAVRTIYFVMAAIAGAVTALAFMRWKEMATVEIVLTLFVGASFAIFATPWIAHTVFGSGTKDASTIAFLAYISASGSNTLLPLAIRWLGRALGQERKGA